MNENKNDLTFTEEDNKKKKFKFTEKDFENMLNELRSDEEDATSPTLAIIAEKVLKARVVNWCRTDDRLKNAGITPNDLMNEIHIHLILKVVSGYLKNGQTDEDGKPFEKNRESFIKWLGVVAQNYKESLCRKHGKRVSSLEDDEGNTIDVKYYDISPETEAARTKLQEALDTVLTMTDTKSINQILCWMAKFVIVMDNKVVEIKANHIAKILFGDKTLKQMYDCIKNKANRIGWVEINAIQNALVEQALDKIHKNGKTYGETMYKEFWMKNKNSENSNEGDAITSASKWISDINKILRDGQNANNKSVNSKKS